MHQVNRLVGILYAGLFLTWLIGFCVPLLLRYPALAVPLLTHRLLPLLACLLVSHWWVRRGQFWVAVFPLLLSDEGRCELIKPGEGGAVVMAQPSAPAFVIHDFGDGDLFPLEYQRLQPLAAAKVLGVDVGGCSKAQRSGVEEDDPAHGKA